jgi:hypothetical protein
MWHMQIKTLKPGNIKYISSWDPSVFNNAKIYLCCGGNCFFHHHLPWRWRQQVPPKCWYPSVKLHEKLLLQPLRNCITSCSHNQPPNNFEKPRFIRLYSSLPVNGSWLLNIMVSCLCARFIRACNTHSVWKWVSPKAGLYILAKRIISRSIDQLKPNLVMQPTTTPLIYSIKTFFLHL